MSKSTAVQNTKIRTGIATFQTQGRLLQELGERLVAKAEVALLELIKNSYDADASQCQVSVSSTRIEISDDGHGMTEREFLDNWMNIATPDKQRTRTSRKYRRRVTGSKGIGRFAVRFLGRKLILRTIAEDNDSPTGRSRLTTTFNWEQIDKSEILHTFEIPYQLEPVSLNEDTGTTLIIEKIRNEEDIRLEKEQRTELLSIVDPYLGLERGDFDRTIDEEHDPGFKVILPGENEDDGIIETVLKNAYARLTIEYKAGKAKYLIMTKDGRTLLRKTISYESDISNGFFADICYLPRRAGLLSGTNVDGRKVYSWLKKKGGIGIVDHGFRIRPYGFEDDDWLNLGLDTGHARRNWRVGFMDEHFPMPEGAFSDSSMNPMIYIPNFHQLVGAVFVESTVPKSGKSSNDLIPSMDREGFVGNAAFKALRDLVRGGMEMLAYADHKEQRRIEDRKRDAAVQELRSDLNEAAKYIQQVPGLSPDDRTAVITHFTNLAKQLDDVEEYYQISEHKLDMMSLLGVMAGFVTHEMQRVLNSLDRMIKNLKELAKRHRDVQDDLKTVINARDSLVGMLDYSSAFIDTVQEGSQNTSPTFASASASLVVQQFRTFCNERNITVEINIEEDTLTPTLPRAFYTGILMNLFTNALKASVGGAEADNNPRVTIKAWNEPKRHVLEVADTGVGIPPHLRKRIWDPLFTTTSRQDYNPLGSGMGLGLTIVRRIITDIKGKIELHEPPPGYTTCFRVEFPRKGD